MPDTTPIYGFPYPCPGETVDATDFADLANAIEAKFVDVDADYLLALNRFNADQQSSIQTIPAGVDTVITTGQYTIPAGGAGIWIVTGHLFNTTTPATTNALRIRIRQGAVSRFGFTANAELNTPRNAMAVGPIVAAAGDVISATVLFSGAATIDVFVDFSFKMLCRIA
jgi:hypothetical protein